MGGGDGIFDDCNYQGFVVAIVIRSLLLGAGVGSDQFTRLFELLLLKCRLKRDEQNKTI